MGALPYVQTVVDLAKSLRWPVLVGLVLVSFRKPLHAGLPDLLRRLRSGGPTGVEFWPTPEQQTASSPDGSISSKERVGAAPAAGPGTIAPPHSPVAVRSLAVDAAAGQLSDEPGEMSSPAQKLFASLQADLQRFRPEDRNPVLLRELSEARIALAHERAYRVIFGSQILLLDRLGSGGPMTDDEARASFAAAMAAFPHFYKRTIFEQWIRYPTESSLVTNHGGTISITDFGRSFLSYCRSLRLPQRPW